MRNRKNLLIQQHISFFLSAEYSADTMSKESKGKQCLSMNSTVKDAIPSLIFTQNQSPQPTNQSALNAKQ